MVVNKFFVIDKVFKKVFKCICDDERYFSLFFCVFCSLLLKMLCIFWILFRILLVVDEVVFCNVECFFLRLLIFFIVEVRVEFIFFVIDWSFNMILVLLDEVLVVFVCIILIGWILEYVLCLVVK